jgi:polar amino acid transport system substrate-binding protein
MGLMTSLKSNTSAWEASNTEAQREPVKRADIKRNLARLCSAALVLFAGLCAELSAHVPDVNYLVYGRSVPPVQIIQDQELHGKGIVTDIVTAIFKGSSYRLETKVLPIKRAVKVMLDGSMDNWLAYGAKEWATTEGKKQIIYSDTTLYQHRIVLLSRRRSGDAAMSLNAIYNSRVVVNFGYTKPWFDELVNRNKLVLHQVKVPDYGLSMLMSGRSDYYMEDNLRVCYAIAKSKYKRSDFQINPVFKDRDSAAVKLIMSKRMPLEMVEFINQGLKRLKRDGTIAAIIKKYFACDNERLESFAR